MKSPLAFILTAALSLSPLGCFTIVNPLQVGIRTQYDQQYFNAEVQLDPELLDDWVQRMPIRVNNAVNYESHNRSFYIRRLSRVLSFYTNGKIVCYSEFENPNGVTHNGKYRLFADTLVVYFDDKTDIEKYLYNIYEDRLTLTELWKYEYTSYTLNGAASNVYSRYQSE